MSIALALAFVLALDPPASAGSASPEFDTRGRLRVHVEHRGFTYSHGWPPAGTSTSDAALLGHARPSLALGLGYAVTRGLVVGTELGLGHERTRTELPGHPDIVLRDQRLDVVLRPYVEYAFLPGTRVRPFVRAQLTLSVGYTNQSFGLEQRGVTWLQPGAGAGVGAHVFVLPRLSLDTLVSLGYSATLLPEAKLFASQQVTLAASIGVSLWLGRRRDEPRARAQPRASS